MRLVPRKRAAVLVLALIAIAGTKPARAEDPESLIRQGIDLRKRGDNATAEGYFIRAYELARTSRSAAQLGLVEMALHNYEGAETRLTEALGAHDAWIERNRVTLETSRDKCRGHLGALVVATAAAGTVVIIDEGPSRPIPDDGVVYLSPGSHDLRATTPSGNVVTKKLTVLEGQKQDLAFEASAGSGSPEARPKTTVSNPRLADSPSAPVVQESGGGLRTAAVGLAIFGLAAEAVGVTFYKLASDKKAAIERTAGTTDLYNEGNGNWKAFDRIGVGLMLGGVVALVGGTGLYVLSRRSSSVSGSRISMDVSTGHALVTIRAEY
jgi:hypothetical protein